MDFMHATPSILEKDNNTSPGKSQRRWVLVMTSGTKQKTWSVKAADALLTAMLDSYFTSAIIK